MSAVCDNSACVECHGVAPYTDEQVALLNAAREERRALLEKLRFARESIAHGSDPLLLLDYMIDDLED